MTPVFAATVATEANASLLLTLRDPEDPLGSYLFEAPLTGRTPPVLPLP